MNAPPTAAPALCALLAFNGSNQLAVRRSGTRRGHAFVGADAAAAAARLAADFPVHTPPVEYFRCTAGGSDYRVFFTQVNGEPADAGVEFRTLEQLQQLPGELAPALAA